MTAWIVALSIAVVGLAAHAIWLHLQLVSSDHALDLFLEELEKTDRHTRRLLTEIRDLAAGGRDDADWWKKGESRE